MASTLSWIGQSFTGWLYRPYFDLGPCTEQAPYHVIGLEYDYRSLAEERPYPRLKASTNPSFRAQIVKVTGLAGYGVDDPRDLPADLRTPRWEVLCENLANVAGLAPEQRVRLVYLLYRMCFYDLVLDLVPAGTGDDPHTAAPALVRTLIRYRRWLEDGSYDYTMAEFADLAAHAPAGIPKVDAHYQMVMQHAKHTTDADGCAHWQERHAAAIDECAGIVSDQELLMLKSRFYRVGGFIPQMRQDPAGMVADMDKAEEYARAMRRDDEISRNFADEMLFPVLESRMKEALWLNEFDLALERAVEYRLMRPLDPKGWLHQGDIHLKREEIPQARDCYVEAARLSPPGGEVAHFMAGHCFETEGELDRALDHYTAALAVDPLGISAAERAADVAGRLGAAERVAWLNAHLAWLTELSRHTAPERVDPYRHIPQPTAASAGR